jgi:GNAT superfamily N-acetyltransferase
MPDRAATARIRKVFVDPGRARRGLGKLMVTDAEIRARRSGFQDFFVRANINAVPLYRALGYREIDSGVMMVGAGVELAVVYMEKTLAMGLGS